MGKKLTILLGILFLASFIVYAQMETYSCLQTGKNTSVRVNNIDYTVRLITSDEASARLHINNLYYVINKGENKTIDVDKNEINDLTIMPKELKKNAACLTFLPLSEVSKEPVEMSPSNSVAEVKPVIISETVPVTVTEKQLAVRDFIDNLNVALLVATIMLAVLFLVSLYYDNYPGRILLRGQSIDFKRKPSPAHRLHTSHMHFLTKHMHPEFKITYKPTHENVTLALPKKESHVAKNVWKGLRRMKNRIFIRDEIIELEPKQKIKFIPIEKMPVKEIIVEQPKPDVTQIVRERIYRFAKQNTHTKPKEIKVKEVKDIINDLKPAKHNLKHDRRKSLIKNLVEVYNL